MNQAANNHRPTLWWWWWRLITFYSRLYVCRTQSVDSACLAIFVYVRAMFKSLDGQTIYMKIFPHAAGTMHASDRQAYHTVVGVGRSLRTLIAHS
ncbi:Protein PAT1 [Trichinella pseudospiralis]